MPFCGDETVYDNAAADTPPIRSETDRDCIQPYMAAKVTKQYVNLHALSASEKK